MRILHSADLHLQAGSPRTLDGFRALLEEAAARHVDILTLSGDLFHSIEDANRLRPTLRNELVDNPFDIVAIPGNHDADCYDRSLEFGPNLSVLHREPYDVAEYDGERIVGVPYRHSMDDELFASLEQVSNDDRSRVLLLHCTLDIGFGASTMGEEATTEYFPIQRATLGEFGFEYVLAGHIHADLFQTALPNGGQFIYPGSPVSHSWKETGPRHAVLVDTDEDEVTPVRLQTFYYDRFSDLVVPGREVSLLDAVREWAAAHEDRSCELEISVRGFVDCDESEFDAELRSAAEPATVINETRTVSSALEHPLYAEFRDRLQSVPIEEWEYVDDHREVEPHVLGVLAELLDNREIRP